MKRVTLIFGLALATFIVLTSGQHGVESNGAPLGSTGAPVEHTCGKSGCHMGSDINTGSAILAIDYNNGNLTYQPGNTYNITVSLTQPGINRFGFQLVALKDADTSNAGELTVTDSERTQIFAGINEFAGRNYITYKYEGTNPYSAGKGQWSFKWTAPEAGAGPVTLYAAAVAANNDATDNGDSVYTTQINLTETPTAVNEINSSQVISVYPNPAHGQLSIRYRFAVGGNTTIDLVDMLSRNTQQLMARYDNTQPQSIALNIAGFAPGIYLLVIRHGNEKEVKKVLIE
ncbi:MAG TPA: choice-of-anchor V domain-containing protein [Chitinophagales bacterium]|nr:choice-of-anchor V domain-containing protein [Chitinophagales bacterium]